MSYDIDHTDEQIAAIRAKIEAMDANPHGDAAVDDAVFGAVVMLAPPNTDGPQTFDDIAREARAWSSRARAITDDEVRAGIARCQWIRVRADGRFELTL